MGVSRKQNDKQRGQKMKTYNTPKVKSRKYSTKKVARLIYKDITMTAYEKAITFGPILGVSIGR